MPVRKSSRNRSLSETNPTGMEEPEAKRHKRDNVIMSVDSNKIDPVEKLLSLTNINNDFLMSLDVCEDQQDNNLTELNELTSLDFTQILNDSIRQYYANVKHSPTSIYNDFGLLNNEKESIKKTASKSSAPTVPFFKNVNFNSVPTLGNFEEYFSYDYEETVTSESEAEIVSLSVEDEDDPKSTVPARITPRKIVTNDFSIPKNKMSFHYRHNHNNLNLSQRSCNTDLAPHDLLKILNKRSILTGKASEMVNNGGFLINDFFL